MQGGFVVCSWLAFRHSFLASGGTNMAAQHQVGKTAAALVLVLVIETQCRVNVNVRLNIPNSGSGSATGHIEGDIFVPGPAPAFQLRPGQLSPSSSHGNKKSTDLIKPREMMSRSSPRLTDKMLEKERHRTTGGKWIW